MTTGINPYSAPSLTSSGGTLEAIITSDETNVDIFGLGAGATVHALTYDAAIPGPTLRLNVNDTVIIRLINKLVGETGIHWHGIELENSADGTPYTQDMVTHEFTPIPPAPGGGTFLYKFKVPRPGIYWYHPHHHSSTNQVFKGLYGMIIVADPNEATLPANTLPPAAHTIPLVLSDVTVCKAVGMNDPQTYDPMVSWPWAGPGAFPGQAPPTPTTLCETSPIDEHGMARGPFAAGDIPNIQKTAAGQTNEGQTVLTNGMNVGARAGTPAAPGALAVGAHLHTVNPGQGLRLQILNASTVRYFRLRLTKDDGTHVELVRIGGEGGLLNSAVIEGGTITDPGGTGDFDTQYAQGEILIPPGSRADVVVVIPNTATSGVWTLWTLDYPRTGAGFSNIPTVPVMHLNVDASTVLAPAYTIGAGTALSSTGTPIAWLGAPTVTTLLDPNDPSIFSPIKDGTNISEIQLTAGPGGTAFGIDTHAGEHDITGYYGFADHLETTRYTGPPVPDAAPPLGDIVELTVNNTTGADHPFHLHGFSMQPIELTNPGSPTFAWPYPEFRDNINIPNGYTLRFRIRLDDRPLEDGVTPGGGLGRWMFHCHIFFHAHLGMIGEVVVVTPSTTAPFLYKEKPNVNVGGSWTYAPSGGTATRAGTFSHPDGLSVTLTSSLLPNPTITVLPTATDPGRWTWSYTGPDITHQYVYITATDSEGRQDQTVFRIRVGGINDGADNGDPHITTIEGKYYDFQAAGEFTLLHNFENRLEVQARQTPVPTATPIVDPNSGLTSCVSVNTAIAVRVGNQSISYQPYPGSHTRLALFLNGKAADIPSRGLDIGGVRVTARPVGDGNEIEVAYPNGAVITITPWFWSSYNIWIMNLSISHIEVDQGILGRIPPGTWLPALPNGATVGPKPDTLHERYLVLYRTFADAWRVTDQTSLFVYGQGESTATFTDKDWPPEQPPCVVKPQFEIPDSKPPMVNIDLETAKRIAAPLTFDDLIRGCVFDIATTGDETLVEHYQLVQDLRLNGTTVQLVADKDQTQSGDAVLFTATVLPRTSGQPTPTGSITFFIDDAEAGPPVWLDAQARAQFKTNSLAPGEHYVRAVYNPGGKQHGCIWTCLCWILTKLGLAPKKWNCGGSSSYRACSSPRLLHTVSKGIGVVNPPDDHEHDDHGH